MTARPQELIAQVAEEQIGLRETSRNRGDGIAKFWDATSYQEGDENREPWCSAFVSWCVQEADKRSENLRFPIPPNFPAVKQWMVWAMKPSVGVDILRSTDLDCHPMRGDIVIFLPHFSHIGIVSGWDAGRRIVHTVEGNTNDQGSREGDGVYRRIRPMTVCGTFLRLWAVGQPA